MRAISRNLRMPRDWFRLAFFAFLLFLLLRGFLLGAFFIPTASMEGTLLAGDFLFVNMALYGTEIPGIEVRLPAIREPEREDVVVFLPPHDRTRFYVKRVVGVPGDTLEMRDKRLLLNGTPKEELYVRNGDGGGDAVHPWMKWQSDYLAAAGPRRNYHPSRDNWGPLVVPEGKFFVLGDNRDNSEDSRYWGFIGREDIKGHPWFVYLSVRAKDDFSTGWFGRVRWERVGHLVD